jgi:hypothetical protein
MSALDKDMDRIDKVCNCHEDIARMTLSVRAGDVGRSMFWVMACEDCAPLRRAALAKEFGDDVRIVAQPERATS